jgi:hypothetical protein
LQDSMMLRGMFQQQANALQAAVEAGKISPEDLERQNAALSMQLMAIVKVEAEALTAHIAMRDEQRKEIVWGDQSHMIAQSEAEAVEKAKHPTGFTAKWDASALKPKNDNAGQKAEAKTETKPAPQASTPPAL